MNRIVSLLLAAALLASLFAGCHRVSSVPVYMGEIDKKGGEPAADTAPTAGDDKTKDADGGEPATPQSVRVGLSYSHSGGWGNYTLEDFARAAQERGWELDVVYCLDDSDAQNEQIETLLSRGFDAIIVSPVDTDAVLPYLERCVAEGVPVVVIEQPMRDDALPDNVTYVGPDCLWEGRVCAEALLEAGVELTGVVEVAVLPKLYSSIERSTGLDEGLEGSGVALACYTYAGGILTTDAQRAVEEILEAGYAGPGTRPFGVFAHHNNVAWGARNVFQDLGYAMGTDVLIACAGGGPEALDMVGAGEMYCVAVANPFIADRVFDVLQARLAGEDAPAHVYVPGRLVTRESYAGIEQLFG